MSVPADPAAVPADPAAVPAALVELTLRIGDPARDLVSLAEGNTSTTVDGELVVKASGARMDRATADDFVAVDIDAAAKVLADGRSTQDGLSTLLALAGAPRGRRASIETLVHVAAVHVGGATWVAHTHPTAVVGLVSVEEGERLWQAPLFPDEAVVVGRPAWVGYHEPGLALGRAVARSLADHADRHGSPPRLVLLGNHGIVALGRSPEEVEAVTTMAVKAARTRLIAGIAGTPRYLDAAGGDALAARADEVARRASLAGEVT
jgi:rhamnose utilization protein RhaD (predicted bifunctional aldolase and dehydrogenase)